jgi:hypothetical protein
MALQHHWLSSRSSMRILSEDGIELTEDESEQRSCLKLFACPYLKHDPLEYAETQSCSKSGWKTIHGLRLAGSPASRL